MITIYQILNEQKSFPLGSQNKNNNENEKDIYIYANNWGEVRIIFIVFCHNMEKLFRQHNDVNGCVCLSN